MQRKPLINSESSREGARRATRLTLFLKLKNSSPASAAENRYEPAASMGDPVANARAASTSMTPEQELIYNNPIQVAIRENTKDLRGTQYDPVTYADYAAENPSFW